MLSALYRSLAGPPPRPPLYVEREARSFAAALGAQTSISGFAPPESVEEFQKAFEDLLVVYRCASLNAGAIGGATLRFYRPLKGGAREEITDPGHPLLKVFHRPNPRMSGRRFLTLVQLSKELTGEAFVEVVTDPARQLWGMNAAHVSVKADGRRGVYGYEYKPGWGSSASFTTDEVWMDLFPNPNDEIRGLAPLRAAREHMTSNALLEKGMIAILRNGMRLGGILTIDKDAKDSQVLMLIDQLKTLYSGVANWGKTLVAAGGKKFEPLVMEPEKLQAHELREWNTGKMMRAYGVWPIVFGDVDMSATRENATTQMLLYQWLTIDPRASALAEEIGQQMIPMLKIPKTEGVFCEFDFSDTPFAKQLALEVAQSQSTLVDRGILTPDEVRAVLGYEPLPNGLGAAARVETAAAVLERGRAFWSQPDLRSVVIGRPRERQAVLVGEMRRLAAEWSALDRDEEAA